MTIRNVPLTVGFSHSNVVGSITLTPEVEKLMIKGALFVLSPSIVHDRTQGDEIMELTLLPLPASEKGG